MDSLGVVGWQLAEVTIGPIGEGYLVACRDGMTVSEYCIQIIRFAHHHHRSFNK